jgi:ribosomal subunit interface protein
VDIVVKGRNVEVPEHFRVHVAEKLTRSERYDPKIIRVDVELSHETNRRQSKTCQRVQITLASRGPAVRAEASAESFYAALDSAVTKLEARLRRAADRRHHRQHDRTPIAAVASTPDELLDGAQNGSAPAAGTAVVAGEGSDQAPSYGTDGMDGAAPDGGPGRIVRVKDHPADPITVDQALFQMELVGHDFYLFNDADTHLASVVYRRRGFDYGLLRLG